MANLFLLTIVLSKRHSKLPSRDRPFSEQSRSILIQGENADAKQNNNDGSKTCQIGSISCLLMAINRKESGAVLRNGRLVVSPSG